HLAPRPAVEQQVLDDDAPAGGHPYPELGRVLPDGLPQGVPAVLGDEELLHVIELPLREGGVAARRLVAGDLRHGGLALGRAAQAVAAGRGRAVVEVLRGEEAEAVAEVV